MTGFDFMSIQSRGERWMNNARNNLPVNPASRALVKDFATVMAFTQDKDRKAHAVMEQHLQSCIVRYYKLAPRYKGEDR